MVVLMIDVIINLIDHYIDLHVLFIIFYNRYHNFHSFQCKTKTSYIS